MPNNTQTQDFRKMRVDQVGSLAPPLKLRAAFSRFKNAEISREDLTPFQDDAIREVIQAQEAIGFPIVTDGEFRRSNFQESFGAAVTGFHVAHEDNAMEGVNRNPFQRAEQNFEAPGAPIITRRRAVERLKLAKNIPLDEYLFSKRVATKPVRQTVLSADRISQRFDLQNSRNVYQSMDQFMADVVAISRQLISELVQGADTYRSMPQGTPRTSIACRSSECEVVAKILMKTWRAQSWRTMRSLQGSTESLSEFICAEEIRGLSTPRPERSWRNGIAKAITMRSPSGYFRDSTTIGSCLNTMTSDPGALSRFGTCQKER